jgi:hypothetical protein
VLVTLETGLAGQGWHDSNREMVISVAQQSGRAS